MDCIFCRICQKEIGNLIYEDEQYVVVMDTSPLSRGHMLVIPKYHAEKLVDLPDAYLLNVLVLIKNIIKKVGTITDYNILQNNGHMQSVKHVHFHIIPYDKKEEEGLSINWNRAKVPFEEIALLGKSIKGILSEKMDAQ